MKSFETPELMQLFPTFVWKGDLKPQDCEPLNRDIVAALGGMGAPLEGLRPGENWQSDHGLHQRAAFGPLLEWVEAAAASALSYLRIPRPLMVTGCWANVNAPGTGHRLHSHRNNYLSGAYYVQVQEGADSINFFDPKPQAGVIRPAASEPTAENTEVAMVRVKAGSLLLFPAWLQHAVDVNRSNRARISLSFNLMFPGFAEEMARPGWKPGLGS
ncbi:MAG TPA: TIGR02466 family protein [Rhizomicrobium sp.]|nr:TIGR02466 family protein [Rhizomicrobium sp.]